MLVIRSAQDELNNFMKKIEHKPLSASPPEEIGQFVVNIDCKSHANHSDGCAESGYVREPQHYANYCKINVNQDIETTLKQDKSEGGMHGPLGPTVAMPVLLSIVYKQLSPHPQ